MLQGSLSSWRSDQELLPFHEILEFVENTDLRKLKLDERHQIGDGIFVVVSDAMTKDDVDCNIEAHQLYIDLQLVLDGTERFGITTLGMCETRVAYNPERDMHFFLPPHEAVLKEIELSAGDFAVFFPTDIHQPCRHPRSGASRVMKAVFKFSCERYQKIKQAN